MNRHLCFMIGVIQYLHLLLAAILRTTMAAVCAGTTPACVDKDLSIYQLYSNFNIEFYSFSIALFAIKSISDTNGFSFDFLLTTWIEFNASIFNTSIIHQRERKYLFSPFIFYTFLSSNIFPISLKTTVSYCKANNIKISYNTRDPIIHLTFVKALTKIISARTISERTEKNIHSLSE